jgi:hypothetical protein
MDTPGSSYMPAGLDAIQEADGRWRWVFVSDYGSESRGQKTHPTERAALSAGRAWLHLHAGRRGRRA